MLRLGNVESELVLNSSKENILKKIQSDGSTFTHIALYNALAGRDIKPMTTMGSLATPHNPLNSVESIHSRLVGYHGFIGGFMFLGTAGATSGADDISRWTTFMLVAGFLCANFGAVISLLALGFIGGMKGERVEVAVDHILKFHKYFYLSNYMAILASFCFVASMNINVHNIFKETTAIIFNVVTVLITMFVFVLWFFSIIAKQRGRQIYYYPDPTTPKDA